MATKNNCSVLTEDPPVCKFYKQLTNEHALQTQELAKFKVQIEAWEVVRAYAICSLSKSEETFDYYRDLTNYELFDMNDSAQIIKTNIDGYVKQDADLDKLIGGVSKSLNDLQVKLHDANNAACAMRNCLQSTLSFKDDKIPNQLKDVIDKAKNLSKEGKQAAEAMVKVAGIHTFSNLETLQPFSTNLTNKLTALKTLTDGLIAAAKKDQETSQAELLGVLKQLNTVEFGSFRTAAIVNGEENTLNFICKEECEPIECVEAICMNLGSKETEASNSSARYLQGDMD
ncbi:hypothetical protein [Nitrosomonas sp.]|uniref:hypothetical protein n=1 Tax=Nitrosomonas sp. TaxID=42353 RepID=UPI00261DB1AB|nr:hypothetical protein [Nitrosomonas sp.]MCW5599973.1 hypothetical protein [Nitrosomonas sp.]